jgi:hypothetical protein
MFLVPIVRPETDSPGLRRIWLFLERNGNHLIELEPTEDPVVAAREFAEANELPLKGEPYVLGSYVFVPIDSQARELSSFYSWKEVAPGSTPPKEVWRQFLWVESAGAKDPWGVNKLLEEVVLAAPPHSAFSVLSAAFSTDLKAEHFPMVDGVHSQQDS